MLQSRHGLPTYGPWFFFGGDLPCVQLTSLLVLYGERLFFLTF